MNGEPVLIGDLLLHPDAPLSLCKALAPVGMILHEAFDRDGRFPAGNSKHSCILSTLAVRDYLRMIGIPAVAAPVYLSVRAVDKATDTEIWSAGVGDHIAAGQGRDSEGNGWSGHLVAVMPTLGWFIDPTLDQMRRPHWPSLPCMAAAPLDPAWRQPGGKFGLMGADLDDRTIFVVWTSQPHNKAWRHAPDAVPDRRTGVIRQLYKFGKRKGQPQ